MINQEIGTAKERGAHLKKIRLEEKLTLKKVETKTGTAATSIARLERGERDIITASADTLLKLAEAYGRHPREIILRKYKSEAYLVTYNINGYINKAYFETEEEAEEFYKSDEIYGCDPIEKIIIISNDKIDFHRTDVGDYTWNAITIGGLIEAEVFPAM